jgi:hypothetical protein
MPNNTHEPTGAALSAADCRRDLIQGRFLVRSKTLQRLAQDWKTQYGHPVEIVEAFVDPEEFCGTVYTASGWIELGQTDGWGRCQRDYYVKHDKPKRLFVRQLGRRSRHSLQAEHLKPDLALVEEKVPPRCTQRVKEIRSIVEHFKELPDYRARVESYPPGEPGCAAHPG